MRGSGGRYRREDSTSTFRGRPRERKKQVSCKPPLAGRHEVRIRIRMVKIGALVAAGPSPPTTRSGPRQGVPAAWPVFTYPHGAPSHHGISILLLQIWFFDVLKKVDFSFRSVVRGRRRKRAHSPDCGIRTFFGRMDTFTGVGWASKCGTRHSETHGPEQKAARHPAGRSHGETRR